MSETALQPAVGGTAIQRAAKIAGDIPPPWKMIAGVAALYGGSEIVGLHLPADAGVRLELLLVCAVLYLLWRVEHSDKVAQSLEKVMKSLEELITKTAAHGAAIDQILQRTGEEKFTFSPSHWVQEQDSPKSVTERSPGTELTETRKMIEPQRRYLRPIGLGLLILALSGCTRSQQETQQETQKAETIRVSGTIIVPTADGPVSTPIALTIDRHGSESTAATTTSQTRLDGAAIGQEIGAAAAGAINAGVSKFTGVSISAPGSDPASWGLGGAALGLGGIALREYLIGRARKREDEERIARLRADRDEAWDRLAPPAARKSDHHLEIKA